LENLALFPKYRDGVVVGGGENFRIYKNRNLNFDSLPVDRD
jgi:uridylate kinase